MIGADAIELLELQKAHGQGPFVLDPMGAIGRRRRGQGVDRSCQMAGADPIETGSDLG